MENKLEYMLKKLEGRKTKIQGQRPIRKMFVICEIKSEDELEYFLRKLKREKNQDPGLKTGRKMFVICEINSEDGG